MTIFKNKVFRLKGNPEKQPMKPRNISVREQQRRIMRQKNFLRKFREKGVTLRTRSGTQFGCIDVKKLKYSC